MRHRETLLVAQADAVPLIAGGRAVMHGKQDKTGYRIGSLIIYGRNPYGPNGGTVGRFVDAKEVISGGTNSQWLYAYLDRLIRRIAREGTTQEDRIWAMEMVLESVRKGETRKRRRDKSSGLWTRS